MIPIHSGDVPIIFGAFDFVYSSIANNVKGYTFRYQRFHSDCDTPFPMLSSVPTNGEGLWLHDGGREGP